MLRERVSSNIYIFTSELYAQVTAVAVTTSEGAVVIDTLPLPPESREMSEFVKYRSPGGVHYVVLTHHHADHTYGVYLYPEAQIVAHTRCREIMAEQGEYGLEQAKRETPELEEIALRLPDLTLDEGEMNLHVGNNRLQLLCAPGHSEDMLAVLIDDAHVLIASDTIMPVPVIVNGDIDTLKQSLLKLLDLRPDSIVQGHGEVILRGEVEPIIQRNIDYLDAIHEHALKATKSKQGRESLSSTDVESFGLSRVALDGRAQDLHTANLLSLYDRLKQ